MPLALQVSAEEDRSEGDAGHAPHAACVRPSQRGVHVRAHPCMQPKDQGPGAGAEAGAGGCASGGSAGAAAGSSVCFGAEGCRAKAMQQGGSKGASSGCGTTTASCGARHSTARSQGVGGGGVDRTVAETSGSGNGNDSLLTREDAAQGPPSLSAFLQHLVAALPGVDPCNKTVRAAIATVCRQSTTLQGKAQGARTSRLHPRGSTHLRVPT